MGLLGEDLASSISKALKGLEYSEKLIQIYMPVPFSEFSQLPMHLLKMQCALMNTLETLEAAQTHLVRRRYSDLFWSCNGRLLCY
jgi:hypothetical protein